MQINFFKRTKNMGNEVTETITPGKLFRTLTMRSKNIDIDHAWDETKKLQQTNVDTSYIQNNDIQKNLSNFVSLISWHILNIRIKSNSSWRYPREFYKVEFMKTMYVRNKTEIEPNKNLTHTYFLHRLRLTYLQKRIPKGVLY